MDPSPNSSKENVTEKLQTAIKTLDRYKFSEKKRGKFKKTIKGIAGYVSHKLLRTPEFTPDKEIAEAIETLKNNYPIIVKFEEGTAQEKDLAAHALQSIKQFNEIAEKRRKSTFWTNIFSKFSTSLTPIDLPIRAAKYGIGNFKKNFSNPLYKKNIDPPSVQEIDLFTMKTITLLKENQIPMSLEILKETPINLCFHEETPHIVTLSQKLSLFPGEDIFIEGKISRSENGTCRPTPVPNSFALSSKAIQSGFPHSLHYHGWALSEELIPASPHFLRNMPLFEELITKMRETARQLLPKGAANQKAKKILEIKKSVFNSNKSIFLNLHRELAKSFVQSQEENRELNQIIDRFFDYVELEKDPYSTLSTINQTINEKFISFPYKSIHEERFNNQMTFNENALLVKSFLDEKVRESLKEIETLINYSENESDKEVNHYIFLMGTILSEGIIPIMMQELSEILFFPPPLLNDFSRKIQTWTYHQLRTFINEVNEVHEINISEESIYFKLIALLEIDTSIFKQKSNETEIEIENDLQPILNEIEEYFNRRYSVKKHAHV